MQYLNIKSYLPDDILVKVDRMSMAHGLECRSPFLDYRIVEFAARLPYKAKIDRNGTQKKLLRLLLKRYLPEDLFDRPKSGFCVPWADWCKGALGTELRSRWRGMRSPYFRPEAAESFVPSYQTRVGWLAVECICYDEFFRFLKGQLFSLTKFLLTTVLRFFVG